MVVVYISKSFTENVILADLSYSIFIRMFYTIILSVCMYTFTTNTFYVSYDIYHVHVTKTCFLDTIFWTRMFAFLDVMSLFDYLDHCYLYIHIILLFLLQYTSTGSINAVLDTVWLLTDSCLILTPSIFTIRLCISPPMSSSPYSTQYHT